MRVLSLFSGIGAFEKALENLNIDFELVNYCEIDKYASKAYSLIHNVSEDLNLKDVTKVDCSRLKDIDLLTYGFPCVPAGTKVKTLGGYKNIEDIVEDDFVLTHKNVYQKVLKTMSRTSSGIYHIKGVGAYNLYLTEEHPLYVLREGKFQWIKVKDLQLTDYLTYNINKENETTDLSDDYLYLIGRYFADGYLDKNTQKPVFCIGKDKQDMFEQHLKGLKYVIYHSNRSCIEYKINSQDFIDVIRSFGSGSLMKEIPDWIVNLNKAQLQQFFDGYTSGNGHRRKDRATTMFTTVNEGMLLQLMNIVIKLYNAVPTISIRVDNRKSTFNNSYTAQFSDKPVGQLVFEDKIATKIKSIEFIDKLIEVFNIEVEKDNSYTVNNVIVHNCQDISIAGHKKGLLDEEGNVTRSGLVFDALNIIKQVKPKYALCENVKMLTSKRFSEEFDFILDCLDKMGYNNYWKVLNAADYGIPQKRERVFIVSIRKDIDKGFSFPEPFKLTKRLKDYLEIEVDKKYYLSEKLTDFFYRNTLKQKAKGNGFTFMPVKEDEAKNIIAKTITTRAGTRMDDNYIKTIGYYQPSCHEASRVLDPSGIAPTIKENHGTINAIKLTELTHNVPQAFRIYDSGGLAVTLKGEAGSIGAKTGLYMVYDDYNQRMRGDQNTIGTITPNCGKSAVRNGYKLISKSDIRKLTPKECFRLMGFEDKDIDVLKENKISDTQLYKMAGNSIVVNVLYHIFKSLLKNGVENEIH